MATKGESALLDAVRATHSLAVRLKEEFVELADTLHAPAARQLAAIGRGIAMELIAAVNLLETDIRNGEDVDIENDVLALQERVATAQEFHTLLERAGSHVIHPVLEPTVRRELAAFKIADRAFVAATREHTYELTTIEEYDLAGLLAEAELKTLELPLLVFRVPARPLDWPLHHVLLYHEIGHALVAEEEGLEWPIPEPLQPDENADERQRIKQESLGQMYSRCFEAWCEEAYADAVGVLLAGPTYALAFCRFLGANFSFAAPTRSHPPLYLRIKLIAQVLRRRGLYDSMPPAMGAIVSEWDRRATEHPPGKRGELEREPAEFTSIVEFLEEGLIAQHDALVARAQARVGARAYRPEYVGEDEQRGKFLQELGIPPIDVDAVPSLDAIGQALPVARVLAAVWAAYLRDASTDIDLEQLSKKAERYAQVIVGALDATEAVQLWSETT